METFEQEKVILANSKKGITLTNYRIRQEQRDFFGDVILKSIMLEHVTSCVFVRESNKKYLIIAVLSFLSGVFINAQYNLKGYADELSALLYLTGAGFIAAYFLTTKKGAFISSPSAQIVIDTIGITKQELYELIDKVEETIVQQKKS